MEKDLDLPSTESTTSPCRVVDWSDYLLPDWDQLKSPTDSDLGVVKATSAAKISFVDTAETNTAGNEWSVRAALADRNRDGLPDLYVVNYWGGDVFTRACTDRGRPVQCFPSSFPGEQDRGYPQSSMGVAVGDTNGDGLADLLVTNFLREPSNLYVQRPDHSFEDRWRQVGLREAVPNLMGWGTQFLDADLDGWLDVVVAHGHLDDYSGNGVPFKMSTKFFRNTGDGHFVVHRASWGNARISLF